MSALLLDANLLVLLVAGGLAPEKVGSHRRLRQFDTVDLLNLRDVSQRFVRHVSIPNVLTEASNHLGSGSQELAPGAAAALAGYIAHLSEVYVPSEQATATGAYARFGLADAAIILAARQHGLTVATAEHALHGTLLSLGLHAINIFHPRTPGLP